MEIATALHTLELLSAEFDLRTTPEAPPEYLFSLVKKHIEGLGYHLVDGPPTDQDRAAYDQLATLTMGSAGRAVRTPLESPLGKWVYDSLVKTSGDPKVVRIRMMGGSVRTDSLVEGIRTIAGMLRSPYR